MRVRGGYAALYSAAFLFAITSLQVKLASRYFSGMFVSAARFAVGALLSGVNPKNLVLNVSAAAGIAQAALSGVQQAVVLVVLVLVGSVGVAAPVVVYLTMHDTADRVLAGWRTWLADNNATVMVVLFLVFGVVLLGKGIGGL